MVLQCNQDTSAELVFPCRYIKEKEDVMYRLENYSSSVDQVLSLDHNFAYYKNNKLNKKPFSEIIDLQNNKIN